MQQLKYGDLKESEGEEDSELTSPRVSDRLESTTRQF